LSRRIPFSRLISQAIQSTERSGQMVPSYDSAPFEGADGVDESGCCDRFSGLFLRAKFAILAPVNPDFVGEITNGLRCYADHW
jgi:hypothetical protein